MPSSTLPGRKAAWLTLDRTVLSSSAAPTPASSCRSERSSLAPRWTLASGRWRSISGCEASRGQRPSSRRRRRSGLSPSCMQGRRYEGARGELAAAPHGAECDEARSSPSVPGGPVEPRDRRVARGVRGAGVEPSARGARSSHPRWRTGGGDLCNRTDGSSTISSGLRPWVHGTHPRACRQWIEANTRAKAGCGALESDLSPSRISPSQTLSTPREGTTAC